ncbi:putative WD repeat-containing protein C9G1.05 [Zalerion maritima]|uniref:WD repeat-containing protein C9G1.05 n=1 Tax=Zalerion maritima TaxID=339359 RepID=A0AAD5RQW0_9PEZI|nr:putative WD repeat-containing protein C9G1.05 [Zalerion maritima]
MSITIEKIISASPATTRGQSTQLSCDPKGERIAYASGKSIFLRSIDDPSASKQYAGHTAQTTVARFSPSGFYVASGDASGAVKVWDAIEAVNTKGDYHLISGRITDIAWDGDSQRIIGVGEGKERFGHCITADSGNSVGEISGHSKVINSVDLRKMRPMRAATGSDDMSTCFLNGPPFKFASKDNEGHKGYVYGVRFSPDGAKLVSVGGDKRIVFYDGKTGEKTGKVIEAAHTGSIFAVDWSKDSKKIVTASADKTVKVWEVESGEVMKTWTLGSGIPDQQVGVVWTPRADGLIVSINLAGDLIYLKEGSDEPSKVVHGHNKTITAMQTGKDGKAIWTGSFDGRVCAWDMSTGTADAITGEGHTGQVTAFAEGDGGEAFSVAWDDTIREIGKGAFVEASKKALGGQPKGATNARGKTFVATLNGVSVFAGGSLKEEVKAGFAPSAIAASGEFVAVGGDGNAVVIYSSSGSSLKETGTKLTTSTSAISALSFSADGKYLAAGNNAGKVIAFRTSDWGVETTRWGAHTAKITSVQWNAAGTHAVSGSLDTHVYVWSLAKPGERVKVLNAHKDGVTGVGWLGDGRVVSTGGDAAVKIWVVKGLK